MKKILLLLFIIGCSSKRTEFDKVEKKAEKVAIFKTEIKASVPPKDKQFSDKRDSTSLPEFIRLFKAVEFDTLHIFSQEKHTIDGPRQIGGIEIPKEFISYIPKNLQGEEDDFPFYACYRFKFSPELTALIVNTPSSLDITSYSVLLFSDIKSKVVNYKGIAENEGDEGNSQVIDSWFIDLNKDGLVDLITKKISSEPDEKNPYKLVYTKSDSVYLGDKGGFKVISSHNYNIKNLKVHDTSNFK